MLGRSVEKSSGGTQVELPADWEVARLAGPFRKLSGWIKGKNDLAQSR
jgi:hypothetical protein